MTSAYVVNVTAKLGGPWPAPSPCAAITGPIRPIVLSDDCEMRVIPLYEVEIVGEQIVYEGKWRERP